MGRSGSGRTVLVLLFLFGVGAVLSYLYSRDRPGAPQQSAARPESRTARPAPVRAEAADPDSIPAGDPVESLQDFEGTPFCQMLGCRRKDHWALRGGGTNYTYDLPSVAGASIEVSAEDSRVFSAGLTLYDRDMDPARSYQAILRPGDRALAKAFVRSILGSNCTAADGAVRANLVTSFHQIMQAPAARCGQWEVRAGQVSDPIVTLDRKQVNG